MTTLLGTPENGFNIKIDDILVVQTPKLKRNSKDELVVQIKIYLKSKDEAYSFSWVCFEPEYETITTSRVLWFDVVEKKLVKYADEVVFESEEYKEAMENYNQILKDLNKVNNE